MHEWPYLVGPGWWPMLDEQLEKARNAVPDADAWVKEKFGRCDVFFNTEADDREALYMIELEIREQSEKICELCGQPGQLRTDRSWVQTLCDRCAGADTEERRNVIMATADEYFRTR